ncbi:MAG: hypothetical protein WDZ91_07300 [Paenibacillaceae bacterium]
MKKFIIGVTLLSFISTANLVSAKEKLNIQDDIQGAERQVMEQVMQNMSPEEQENVIYVDENGKVYANKSELKKEVEKLTKIKDNLFEDGKGNRFAFPDQGEKPTENKVPSVLANSALVNPFSYFKKDPVKILSASYPSLSGGTGPYRRVFSKPNYTWASAYAYLPGGTDMVDNNAAGGNGDTGYVYTGGWGNTGSAVDAGFMHGTTNHDWAPMLQINGSAYGQTPRLSESQNVFLKFWVSGTGQISMYFAGIEKSTGLQITRTYVYSAPGFSTTGGNIIKRMTTIGQTTESFTTGSHIRNVHWYSTYIGTSSTSNHAWVSTDQATDSFSGYHSYPNSTVVTVSYVNAGEETDNINL